MIISNFIFILAISYTEIINSLCEGEGSSFIFTLSNNILNYQANDTQKCIFISFNKASLSIGFDI